MARELGVICPDDTALHLAVGPGALLFADAVIRAGRDEAAAWGSCPTATSATTPRSSSAGVRIACARLAQADDFDALLFAHGHPWVERRPRGADLVRAR